MNKRALIFLCISTVMFSFSNVNSEEKEGCLLDIESTYTGDIVGNLSGGIKKGTAYLGMANIKLTLDAEKQHLWKGGSFYLNFANTHGDQPSQTLIGDFQVASNIEAGDHTFVQELWYSQQLSNVKLTVGLQDLNVELANSEHGALYRSSSFGVHSTISDNVPSPVFPLTTLGLTLDWRFRPTWMWITAIYDGSPTEFEKNSHNLSWKISKYDGYLWLNELHKENLISSKLKGILKLGVYYHNHLLLPEEDDAFHAKENYGFYGVIDQIIKQDSNGKSIGFFTQISYSPKLENNHNCYLGGGINFYGVGKRILDVLGLAVANAKFRHNAHSETILELTYKAVLGENIYLQPDFQFIAHPSGTEADLNNAVIASLRFGLNF